MGVHACARARMSVTITAMTTQQRTEATTEGLLTTAEVAERLNVSEGTVRRWANDPEEPLTRVYLGKHKRTVRFRPDEVEAYKQGRAAPLTEEEAPDSR